MSAHAARTQPDSATLYIVRSPSTALLVFVPVSSSCAQVRGARLHLRVLSSAALHSCTIYLLLLHRDRAHGSHGTGSPCTRFAWRAPNRDRAHGSHGAVWIQGCALSLCQTERIRPFVRKEVYAGSVHTVRTALPLCTRFARWWSNAQPCSSR